MIPLTNIQACRLMVVVDQKECSVQVPTYSFTYHVRDSYSGDVHHHTESKTDYATKGQYSVKLPDGRTQVSSSEITLKTI